MDRFTNDQWKQFIASMQLMATKDLGIAAQCLLAEFHLRAEMPIVMLRHKSAPMVVVSLLGDVVSEEQNWIANLIDRHEVDSN
jgi:hypothetical protein